MSVLLIPGAVSKKTFSALRASVWSRNKGGRVPRAPPLDSPLIFTEKESVRNLYDFFLPQILMSVLPKPIRVTKMLFMTLHPLNRPLCLVTVSCCFVCLDFFGLEITVTPKIDLGVIIGSYSDTTFKKMKDTMNVLVDNYGTKDARYSLITSGSEATTIIDFADDYKNTQGFKNAVARVQRPEGTPDLKKALDLAQVAFERAPSRLGAKKILVVFIDQRSVNYPQVLTTSGERLHKAGVVVVPVAVGSLADVGELTRLAPSKGVVIEVKSEEGADAIAQKIMSGAVQGKCSYYSLSLN